MIRRWSRDEDGFTAVEWSVGLGVIVVPVAILVLTIGTWGERTSMARLIAQETAREVVLADTWDAGITDAQALAREIAANHGMAADSWCEGDGCLSVEISGLLGDDLIRGNEVQVTVNVPIPAVAIPFIPEEWTETVYTADHGERVDDYRSFPP